MRDTEINWTDHTFNPWWGCVEVSPACDHCYARALSERFRRASWGREEPRIPASEETWRQPLGWNRVAAKAGRRDRVFCASMADVFERRADLEPWRRRLWDLIGTTPNLDWLLLTKRHDNVRLPWGDGEPWGNVWVGMTVEDQLRARIRLPYLRRVNAVVRFVSAEPLLGPLDLDLGAGSIDWVICGGESGPKARPMEPDWARSLRDQCAAHGVAYHLKQWGEFGADGKRRGKRANGHLLDGVEHFGSPTPRVIVEGAR